MTTDRIPDSLVRLSDRSRALLFDPHGNCLSTTTDSGFAEKPIHYDAYGAPVWFESTDISYRQRAMRQPLQYKGQYGYYADVHTGLSYCHNRYYDPMMGRWMSIDPIGLEGGTNVYAYCPGDPLNSADPSGLFDWDWEMYWRDVGDVFRGYGDAGVGVVMGIVSLPETVRHYNSFGWSWGNQFVQDSKVGMGHWWDGMQGKNGARGFGMSFGNTLITAASVAAPFAKVTPTYARLLPQAQLKYPKLAGKIQKHHVEPQYLGGPKSGPLSEIDAAYHQLITNEFRKKWGYGNGPVSPARRTKIMKQVYKKYPLPKRKR